MVISERLRLSLQALDAQITQAEAFLKGMPGARSVDAVVTIDENCTEFIRYDCGDCEEELRNRICWWKGSDYPTEPKTLSELSVVKRIYAAEMIAELLVVARNEEDSVTRLADEVAAKIQQAIAERQEVQHSRDS